MKGILQWTMAAGLGIVLPTCLLGAPSVASSSGPRAIVAEVRTTKAQRTVVLVGRTEKGVLGVLGESPAGKRFVLPTDDIEEVNFQFEYNEEALAKAVQERKWTLAARLLLPALSPALPYLDLPNNNAADLTLDAGNYLMRSALSKRVNATTTNDAGLALEQYTNAYVVLKQAAAATWSPIGKRASLGQIRCLLALNKTNTAARAMEKLDEPAVGDSVYGLYWLVRAELAVQKRDFPAAMDAAVNSLCFEDKDVETFPDALLMSARCYEELENWHRARDVYYEVASVFPGTEWSEVAVRRLRFIDSKALTAKAETSLIQDVFFGMKEDMNTNVDNLLKALDKPRTAAPAAAAAGKAVAPAKPSKPTDELTNAD